MPFMDGYEATIEFKRIMKEGKYPNTPIIAVSANDSEIDKENCKKVGMVDHISKPVDKGKLKTALSD